MTRSICFVSPWSYGYFNPEKGFTGGGAQRQIYLLSTALADRFDVHVVVGDYGQPKTEHRDGVTLHRAYPRQPRQHIFQPAKHLAVLGDAMRRADADLYIDRNSPRKTAFTYLLARLLRKRLLYHVANDANLTRRCDALNRPTRALFTRAVRHADARVAQSTHQQELLTDGYDSDSTVVPNGYPAVDSVRPATERDGFLWVGRFNEQHKRPHLLLELAERLPESEFTLIGPVDTDNDYQRQVQNRAERLPNVSLLGAVDPREIHGHYRTAVALVSTSAYEGFPNVFLEAWRQGTPVVSLDVDPGRYGIPDEVCANGNLDRLEQFLSDLQTDTAYRSRLASNAYELFTAEFEQSTVATKYGDVIERVLDGQ